MPRPPKKQEKEVSVADVHAIVKSAVEGALDGLNFKDYVKIGVAVAAVIIYLLTWAENRSHTEQVAATLKAQSDSTLHAAFQKKRILDSTTAYKRDSAQVAQHNQIIRADDTVIRNQTAIMRYFHIKQLQP